MTSKDSFVRQLTRSNFSQIDRALGLLWYYREMQEFDDRTPLELANDLDQLGFPRPNPTRLKDQLNKSRYAVNGSRRGAKRINIQYFGELSLKFSTLLDVPRQKVTDSVLPNEWVSGTQKYLEQLVYQINGAYDFGFFDGCAVLMRRLMESLVIQCYIESRRSSEIKVNGLFMGLDGLIKFISVDKSMNLSRNSPKTMRLVKQLGDTAAHDRSYITPVDDIKDFRVHYRRLVSELLVLAGIRK